MRTDTNIMLTAVPESRLRQRLATVPTLPNFGSVGLGHRVVFDDVDGFQTGGAHPEASDATTPRMLSSTITDRLAQIESLLAALVKQQTIKDMYTTDEVAQILGRQPFTVREWCRLGRVRAQKRACGRGLSKEWVIPHAELQRIKNEGLLTSEH